MAQITLQDEIAELKREIALREAFYPSYIARGRLRPMQAEKQLGCLKKTLQRLLLMQEEINNITQPKLF